MKTRIIVGLALTALLAGVLYLGGWMQVAVFTLAALLAVHEMGVVLRTRGIHPWLLPAYAFGASYCVLHFYLCSAAPLAVLGFVCFTAVVVERLFNEKRTTEDCFGGLILFLYPLPLFTVLMLLGGAFPRNIGVTALFMAFAGPLVGDTLAYFIGSFFGKHKLCPAISPKKTVEGGIASLFGGILGGALVFWLQGYWGGNVPLEALLILGAICGLLGQVGDLFASLIKRWAGVKDYGSIFPGHGGIMDRLDSVLFCAPALFTYFYFMAK